LALSPDINVMQRAARKAGRSLLHDFGEVEQLQVSRKGPSDFVSTADMKAEKIIQEDLAYARPNFGFLMEENGEIEGKDANTRWIIDPLDGTTNFLHGIPHWCISIALEKDDEIIAGLIYQPISDEMFWAEKGKGAFMNSRRTRVSGRRNINDCVIGLGTPQIGRGDHKRFLGELEAVMAVTAGTRRLGAAALDLAFVAAGRLDGFWEDELSPWDIAAGGLIVRESGGYATDMQGGKDAVYNGNILAANPQIHPQLVQLVGGCQEKTATA